jgi:hypothetical protein
MKVSKFLIACLKVYLKKTNWLINFIDWLAEVTATNPNP